MASVQVSDGRKVEGNATVCEKFVCWTSGDQSNVNSAAGNGHAASSAAWSAYSNDSV